MGAEPFGPAERLIRLKETPTGTVCGQSVLFFLTAFTQRAEVAHAVSKRQTTWGNKRPQCFRNRTENLDGALQIFLVVFMVSVPRDEGI